MYWVHEGVEKFPKHARNASFLAHAEEAGCLTTRAAGTSCVKGTAKSAADTSSTSPSSKVGLKPCLALLESTEMHLEDQQSHFIFVLFWNKFSQPVSKKKPLAFKHIMPCFHATEQLLQAQPAQSCLDPRGWDENYLLLPDFLLWSSPCSHFIVLIWLSSFCQPKSTSHDPEPQAWLGAGGTMNGYRTTLPPRKHLENTCPCSQSDLMPETTLQKQ